MRVRLTARARADISAIREFYLHESRATADRVRRSINQALDLIASRPTIGPRNRRTPEIRSKLVLHYPYRIHYRVTGDQIEVLHIRHTARRPWPETRA